MAFSLPRSQSMSSKLAADPLFTGQPGFFEERCLECGQPKAICDLQLQVQDLEFLRNWWQAALQGGTYFPGFKVTTRIES